MVFTRYLTWSLSIQYRVALRIHNAMLFLQIASLIKIGNDLNATRSSVRFRQCLFPKQFANVNPSIIKTEEVIYDTMDTHYNVRSSLLHERLQHHICSEGIYKADDYI